MEEKKKKERFQLEDFSMAEIFNSSRSRSMHIFPVLTIILVLMKITALFLLLSKLDPPFYNIHIFSILARARAQN